MLPVAVSHGPLDGQSSCGRRASEGVERADSFNEPVMRVRG